jgi:hypothetical protein
VSRKDLLYFVRFFRHFMLFFQGGFAGARHFPAVLVRGERIYDTLSDSSDTLSADAPGTRHYHV